MLNICICQLIKDEQRYIEEWIDYYLNLGISKFVLFEDWNSSSHKEVLSKYGDKIILYELLNILDNNEKEILNDHNKPRQLAVWQCFYRLHKNDFDCCLFIDPDEYLHCSKNQFIDEIKYFIENTNAKILRYKWQCITASGYIRDPNPNNKYSIVNTYTKFYENDSSELNNNFKCLIFLNKLNNQNDFNPVPHGPYEYNWVHYSPILIYHYLTKSWDEFKWRLYVKGELTESIYPRKIEIFFEINSDLQQYKEQLLKECENLEYKYNDYN